MTCIAKQVNAMLGDWDDTPVFLQVRHEGDVTPVLAGEFSQQIAETARQLHKWGIREKHLVPVLLGNSTDFVAIFLALISIGAVPVLAKLEYRAFELEEIFRNAQPSAVIAEKEHLQLLKPYLQDMIVISRTEDRLSLVQTAEAKTLPKDIPEDTASINYTYRGYGYPLGAIVSHDQYLHGARVLQEGLHGAAGEKMLVILPMPHILTMVGCILVPLLYRMTSVIVDTVHPRLLFQYIRDFRIEHITAIPEIYELLYRLHDSAKDLSSLKVFISGGSTLTPESYSRIKNAFSIDLCHGYGLTEFAPVSRNKRNEARLGTVGPLCDQVECRINVSAPDGSGEILIKTPHMIGTYYRKPFESAEAHCDDWFKTGDIGRIEQDHLVFLKELKRTCKINGNLVDLEEVARAIRMDKDVAEVHVESEQNALIARLALCRGIDIEQKAKSLKVSMRNVLAEYKIPKRFCAIKKKDAIPEEVCHG